ncbi:50S ribosomal protein L27 [Candidatus Shapirobacteria bacterium CG08_land_8_20_14_0_20_39_18]|uniref:Large ribosomal subunit protein bL27 n=1 Tax=Candidatus Shapirobacteria bacterium CG08_land_8_20_14_0_20_39_18 TaxID=1974883 RepID=A0A2M6XBX4_9BACT|nr:MAG: 50S ribosomal protein L27 [Candidatus Shapirobacteria bacterium CG08_land_8_20_14_0_20_39_18]PIY65334.1 MAG: 50S ribosomal protein L27 [Candidatus Shapirobacteria bacterium CG_4_10_14_0_8_um_filter_39_15]PJE68487.1 MAG: 50S ribosomal protein L27 [Candidatus Shapirobacteria bacterium CG10_big_fil_rev_8_21_14_0_10_38_8]
MSKTKAGGKVSQKTNRVGRRLGLKISGGQKVKNGMILVRQKGTKYHPGEGVGMGRDYTIFALKEGSVVFKKNKSDVFVNVI